MKPTRLRILHDLALTLGGFSALGREFQISGWAVKKWYLSGVIPPERVPTLIALADRHGFEAKPWHIRPDVYPVSLFESAAPP
jgi:hypothetical protein